MAEQFNEQNNSFTPEPAQQWSENQGSKPNQATAEQSTQYGQPLAQPQRPQYQPYGAQPQNGQYNQPYGGQYPPQYQYPQYQQPYYDKTGEVMSVGSYIGMFFINMIPIVNIICWIVWLVSPNTNKNKKNYIIANIVFSIIVGVVYGILLGVLIAAGVFSRSDFNSYFNSFIHFLF